MTAVNICALDLFDFAHQTVAIAAIVCLRVAKCHKSAVSIRRLLHEQDRKLCLGPKSCYSVNNDRTFPLQPDSTPVAKRTICILWYVKLTPALPSFLLLPRSHQILCQISSNFEGGQRGKKATRTVWGDWGSVNSFKKCQERTQSHHQHRDTKILITRYRSSEITLQSAGSVVDSFYDHEMKL